MLVGQCRGAVDGAIGEFLLTSDWDSRRSDESQWAYFREFSGECVDQIASGLLECSPPAARDDFYQAVGTLLVVCPSLDAPRILRHPSTYASLLDSVEDDCS